MTSKASALIRSLGLRALGVICYVTLNDLHGGSFPSSLMVLYIPTRTTPETPGTVIHAAIPQLRT